MTGLISNHDDLRRLVEWYGIAYQHLPVAADNRATQESRLLQTLADAEPS